MSDQKRVQDKTIELHERMAEKAFREHRVTERISHGCYRQWRCHAEGTWIYAFDVTTYPGWLIVSGDIGFLAVSRERDMIPWCRGSVRSIDYFAEKVPREIPTTQYDHEVAAQWIREEIAEAVDYCGEEEAPKRIELLKELPEPDSTNEWEFKQELYDSGLIDGCDYPNFDNYTSRFLWCREALKWFLTKLDAGEVRQTGDPPQEASNAKPVSTLQDSPNPFDKLAALEEAIHAGGYDLSPCLGCGVPIVCLPDGQPMCEKCAEREAAGQ